MTQKPKRVRRFDVHHKTTYDYAQSVSLSQHFMHLTPRSTPGQLVETSTVTTSPEPATWREATDFFGNKTTLASLDEEHFQTVIQMKSRVTVQPNATPNPEDTPIWTDIVKQLAEDTSDDGLRIRQFCYRSPKIRFGDEILALAQSFFGPDTPVLVGAINLMGYIHKSFTYDGEATEVDTPIEEVLRLRRGVCQDFAHLQIAGLRSLGLPARYVSGYLMTHPPEGEEKLQGADASHAWVSIWVGKYGWVDLDPTNNIIVGDEHITLAWGRDYADVSPINGVTFGGGDHSVRVEVDVVPLDR
ncbi:MAG: transglutaminase family protein [Pseudomonadota bacterium]